MKTRYEQILETEGKEAASAYMRNIRKKVNPENIKGRPKVEKDEVQNSPESKSKS